MSLQEAVDYATIKSLKDSKGKLSDFSMVIATEKIDGAQSKFGLVNNEFFVATHNCLIGPNERIKDSYGLYSFAKDQEEVIRRVYPGISEIIIVGEWYGPGICGKIKYSDEKRFIVFDVCIYGFWLAWDGIEDVSKNLGYDVVPLLYEGPFDEEILRPMTICESTLAKSNGFDGQMTEGIVLRTRKTFFDNQMDRILIKFKNPAFEELKSAREQKEVVEIIGLDGFVDEWVTDERLTHVLTHLGDNPGVGDIIKEINLDIQKECNDSWKEISDDWKPVSKGITYKTKALLTERGIIGKKNV